MLADYLKLYVRTRSAVKVFNLHGLVTIRSKLGPGWINGAHAGQVACYLAKALVDASR